MSRRVPLLLVALVLIAATLSFLLFYRQESVFFLFVGIFVLIAGLVSVVLVQTVDLIKRDKMIDYEMVEQYSLHLVDCPECKKENILEDQYCRHCGAKLEGEQDV
jgi:predicted RNA-binding Zn-ribbon protein involved in translation (DUF1610 family)